ncbi:hypothetical protein Ahy_B05g077354 isoform B [Arachis hypogaea]|uniref:Gamma-soluble NSF attachment protein n=1 Tax=Arachis hypogaea TaxID=3818 RepID=A0A444Z4S0_ARAHY|nr:hypothetical protein Ahy_B05g077354 isoform B [Arachis hypogaea]
MGLLEENSMLHGTKINSTISKETRHLALLGFLPPSTRSLVLYSSPSVVPISDHRAPSLVLCSSLCAVATALLLPVSRVRWWVISPCLASVSARNWSSATSLYEQAANRFSVAKDYERSKAAYEKASKGQEMLASPWDAAKHMESAANMAKELRNWREVVSFSRKGVGICGRPQPASDALAKGARALEETMPEEAIQLYTDVITILEEDGGG